MKLSENEKTNYFYNSYIKADGLLFIKVEENLGFELALEIDHQVWEVFPKIQARFSNDQIKRQNGFGALRECLDHLSEY